MTPRASVPMSCAILLLSIPFSLAQRHPRRAGSSSCTLRKAMSSLRSVSAIRYLATVRCSPSTSHVFEPHLKQNGKSDSKFNPFKHQSSHFSDLGAGISIVCDIKSSVLRESIVFGGQQQSCDPSLLRPLPAGQLDLQELGHDGSAQVWSFLQEPKLGSTQTNLISCVF